MEQVSGWSEQGGTSIVIPGTQGSGTQRFQQSFRGATVTVRDSSNNLATIYSDDLATPTAKANPFTASSTTGAWNFFTTTGTYTLTFSGGSILAPFSITVNVGLGNAGGVPSYAYASLPTSKTQNAGDIARVTDSLMGLWMDSGTQWSKLYPTAVVTDFAGANAGAKIIAAIAGAPSTGCVIDCRGLEGAQTVSSLITISKPGITLLLGDATFTFSGAGQFVISNGINAFRIIGNGGSLGNGGGLSAGGTRIVHTSDNYLIEVAATSVVHSVQLKNLVISTTSTNSAAGAIRVGRTTETFSENIFRQYWFLQNVSITGPGAATASSVGVSFSQMSRMRTESLHIELYETNLIMASTTECVMDGLQSDFYKYGLRHTRVTSHPAGGASSDVYEGAKFHGPTIAAGESIYVDVQNVIFNGTYCEINTAALTGANFVHFTGEGQYSRWFGAFFNYTTGTMTNTMLFDAGAARNCFFGLMTNSGAVAVSMANPTGGGGSVQNVFIGCDSFFVAALATAISNEYAIAIGADSSGKGLAATKRLAVNTTVPSASDGRLFVDLADATTSIAAASQAWFTNTNSTDGNYVNVMLGKDSTSAQVAYSAQVRTHATGLADAVIGVNPGGAMVEGFRINGSTKAISWNSGTPIVKYITQSETVNPGSIAANTTYQAGFTVTGALDGDTVVITPPSGIEVGLIWSGWVSASNTVAIRIANVTVGPITPASATWFIAVIKK